MSATSLRQVGSGSIPPSPSSRLRRAFGIAVNDGLSSIVACHYPHRRPLWAVHPDNALDFLTCQRFVFQQALREAFELLFMLGYELVGPVIALIDDALDLLLSISAFVLSRDREAACAPIGLIACGRLLE